MNGPETTDTNHSLLRAVSLIALALLLGCQAPAPTNQQLDTGLIWMFPGIEGGYWSLTEARRALRNAGVQAAIRTHEWRYPFGWLLNLTDHQGNRADAAEVAAQIDQYRRDHPHQPIDLLGYSGGGGVAIMVAEALPAHVKLRNVILVHAAVSPTYDLTTALTHIDGQLVNFYSLNDWFMLGLGTHLFGTIDRAHTDSAGKVGFDVVRAVPDPLLRTRLQQHRWNKHMLNAGHLGGHLTIMFYEWNKKFVAPYLLAAPPAANVSCPARRPPTAPPDPHRSDSDPLCRRCNTVAPG